MSKTTKLELDMDDVDVHDLIDKYVKYLHNIDNFVVYRRTQFFGFISEDIACFVDHITNFAEPVFKRNYIDIKYSIFVKDNSDWTINILKLKKDKQYTYKFYTSMYELNMQLGIIYKDEYTEVKRKFIEDIYNGDIDDYKLYKMHKIKC